MASIGWVALHRKLQEHWLWNDKPFSKGQAWIDLLLLANHEDKKIVLGNELIEVKQGSFISSELKLMERWGWGKTKTRAFLDLLQNDQMIVKKTDRKKTTITIVNYKEYAVLETIEKPQPNHEQTASRPRADTNNNNNNVNKYIHIKDMFNEICVSFPRLTVLSDRRKQAIKARLNKYTVEQFIEMFTKAEASEFLKGSNNRNWQANFDWLIKDSNFAKVLDGNYDNKPKGGKTASGGAYDLDAYEKMLDKK